MKLKPLKPVFDEAALQVELKALQKLENAMNRQKEKADKKHYDQMAEIRKRKEQLEDQPWKELSQAVLYGDTGKAQQILESGAANANSDFYILCASYQQNHAMAELLIKHGANLDVKAKGDFESTALDSAIFRDDTKMLMILLEGGANPRLRCSNRTLKQAAEFYGSDKVLKILNDPEKMAPFMKKKGKAPKLG